MTMVSGDAIAREGREKYKLGYANNTLAAVFYVLRCCCYRGGTRSTDERVGCTRDPQDQHAFLFRKLDLRVLLPLISLHLDEMITLQHPLDLAVRLQGRRKGGGRGVYIKRRRRGDAHQREGGGKGGRGFRIKRRHSHRENRIAAPIQRQPQGNRSMPSTGDRHMRCARVHVYTRSGVVKGSGDARSTYHCISQTAITFF